MSIEAFINEKPVEEFVASIRQHVQTATKSWWKIAECFAEAREMYGADSDKFKRLCKETKFSESKASKLATIASSERLKKYAVKLSAVHSWGTLYAIAALKDENFEQLKEKLKLDDEKAPPVFITQAEVDKVRLGKHPSSFFKNYAIVQIDEDALRGDLLTGSDLEKLHSLLDEVEALSSYVQVKRTGIDDKEASKFMARVVDKEKQIARRRLAEAFEAMLARHMKRKGEKKRGFEVRVFGQSRSELLSDFDADPKAAFEKLGVEYDQAAFFNEALAEVGKTADKFAEKVLSRLPKLDGANDARQTGERRAA